jgi:uncharacterized membrane protein
VRRDSGKLWAILGLAAVLRLVPALRRPLQVDEGYSLHQAALPLGQAMQALRDVDVHPPLFLWLTHLLVAMNAPDAVLRVLAAFLGILSVVVLYAIVRIWHDENAALVAALCAAVMPSLIYYDITIRMYGLFDALALASFLVLSCLYARDDLPAGTRRALWTLWALLCAALWYTQYLGLIVVGVQLLYAALVRREGLVRSLAGGAAAFALWLPQLATFLHQLPSGGVAFPFYAQHQLAALYELVGQATIAVQTHGAAYFVAWTSLIGWCWLAAALIIALPGNGRALSMWLGLPAAVTFLYSAVAHKLLYTDRYYLLLAYALCALTGVAAVRLNAHARIGPLPGWVAAGALTALGCLYAFDPAYYSADWPAVADLLQVRSHSADMIIFDQGSPYYVLDRGDALRGHPLILVARRSDVEGAIRLSRPFPRIWLVLFQSGPVDPDAAILHALAQRYHLEGYWEFFRRLPAEGASVVLFAREGHRPAGSRVLHGAVRKSASS